MKYDLTSLFYDYIQEEENKAFRREYWNRPANSELERAMQPILMTCSEDGEKPSTTTQAVQRSSVF